MKEYKCIELFRYHLSENTRKKFIEPVTASDGCIEMPPMNMPNGIELALSPDHIKAYININRSAFLLKRENEPNTPELPEDLVNLINWAITKEINIITMDLWSKDYCPQLEETIIPELPLYNDNNAQMLILKGNSIKDAEKAHRLLHNAIITATHPEYDPIIETKTVFMFEKNIARIATDILTKNSIYPFLNNIW